MDSTALLTYGPWVFLIYLLLTNVLPKLWPDLFKLLDKQTGVQDRLFNVIEGNQKASIELAKALTDLHAMLETFERRLQNVENVIVNESRDKLLTRVTVTTPEVRPTGS